MRPKLIYRSGWCVLWEGLIYPFGKIEDAAGAALRKEYRLVNPFTGYTPFQAELMGYR